jgi:hypothetical protein
VTPLFARPAAVPADITLANIAEALGLDPDTAHGDDVLRAVYRLHRTHPHPAAGRPIVLRLPFTSPPVSANEARGAAAHWSAQTRAKRQVAQAVTAVVRQARVRRLDRVAVTLTWYAPDHGIRDCDGLYVMLKAALDALTPPEPAIPKGTPTKSGKPRERAKAAKLGAGILDGDHAGIVESTTTRIVQADPDPRVELTLHPLPPAPAQPKRRSGATRRPSRARHAPRPTRRGTPRVATLDNLHSPAGGATRRQDGANATARPTPQETR